MKLEGSIEWIESNRIEWINHRSLEQYFAQLRYMSGNNHQSIIISIQLCNFGGIFISEQILHNIYTIDNKYTVYPVSIIALSISLHCYCCCCCWNEPSAPAYACNTMYVISWCNVMTNKEAMVPLALCPILQAACYERTTQPGWWFFCYVLQTKPIREQNVPDACVTTLIWAWCERIGEQWMGGK